MLRIPAVSDKLDRLWELPRELIRQLWHVASEGDPGRLAIAHDHSPAIVVGVAVLKLVRDFRELILPKVSVSCFFQADPYCICSDTKVGQLWFIYLVIPDGCKGVLRLEPDTLWHGLWGVGG